jgi:3-oxoacyl-[acyl-carrier protein] reductase
MTQESKLALVTGASRGIGRAIAERLRAEGYRVAGTATSDKGAEAIDGWLGDGGIGVRLDVTDPKSIVACLAAIEDRFGGLPDILINNAGITRDNLLMRMKEEEWQSILDTNLTSVFRLTQRCLKPMMKKRWGRIVSIGSVVGSIGNPGQTNYAAAKAGLVGFSKALAREVGSRGITVNVVAPGFIDTDMTRALSEEQRIALASQIPAARLGSPEEVAHAVAFLASDLAGYITGHTVHVNGGMFLE